MAGYTPTTQGGQGASQPATGQFPTGLDLTGLGVSSAEYNKVIPTGKVPGAYDLSQGLVNNANVMGPVAVRNNGPQTDVSQITFAQALQGVSNMDPASIMQLQQDMYQAKLYAKSYYRKGADDPVTGLIDAPTLTAYIKTLRMAYNGQKPVTDVLTQAKAQHPELANVQSPDQLAPAFKLTPVFDIAAGSQSSAQKLLGRNATPAEMQAIASAMHAQEMAAQKTQFDADPNTAYLNPTQFNATDFADQYFQQNNTQEVAQNTALNQTMGIMDALRSIGTTTPKGKF